MASTDTRTNLSLIADLIHKGSARIVVFHDSQFTFTLTDRISAGIYRTWSPSLGWAGRAMAFSTNATSQALGQRFDTTTVTALTQTNRTAKDTIYDGSGDAAVVQNFNDYKYTGDATDDSVFAGPNAFRNPTGVFPYAGDEDWQDDSDVVGRILYKSNQTTPAVGFQLAPGRVATSGGVPSLGSYTTELTPSGYGSVDALIPTSLGTGAPYMSLKTHAAPMTEISGQSIAFLQWIMAKDDGAGGMADGLAFVSLMGEGGETVAKHIDTAFYGDAAERHLIGNSFSPNVCLIMLGHNMSSAAPAEISGGVIQAQWKTNYEALITRIKGHYAANGLPYPLFLLITPWVGDTSGWTVSNGAIGRDYIYSIATAAGAGYGIINNYNIHGAVEPIEVAGDSPHPDTAAHADSLASSMWSQITAASRNNLLEGLVSHWKLDEASGTRVDSVTESGNDIVEMGPGTDPTAVAAKLGNGVNFTNAGTGSLAILAANKVNLNPLPATDFSIAFWFNSSSFPAANTYFTRSTNSATTDGYSAHHDSSGRFVFQVFTTAGQAFARVVSGMTAGKTYLAVCRHEHGVNQFLDLYDEAGVVESVSGASANRTTQVGADATVNFFIGGANTIGTQQPVGWVDSLSFWQRKITDAEIATLWNNGNGLPFSQFGGGGLGLRGRHRGRTRN